MEKLHQIFLSSTFTDLIDARDNIIECILKAGHHPKCMEYFPASGCSPEEYITEAIEDSDIVVVLLNNRYGKIEERLGDISFTHFEYNSALKMHKRILCFINDNAAYDEMEKEAQREKLDKLKQVIKKDKLCMIFKFNDDNFSILRENVISSISSELPKCPSHWVRKESTVKDSYTISCTLSIDGNVTLEEIPMYKIMTILEEIRPFSFEEFEKKLAFQLNLGRQETLNKHELLGLLQYLQINEYVKLVPDGDNIKFRSEGKSYTKPDALFRTGSSLLSRL